MIIGSDAPLEIGTRGSATHPQHGEVPYYVIRQSNFEEWLQSFKDDGKEPTAKELDMATTTFTWFYEVSVD